MAKKMLIDATHSEETRVVVVDGNKVEEFDFETINKRQLAGNIYLAKVTRVEPSLQAAFVDYGGNRHGFLAFAEIHPDYYQIPMADRKALLDEERALARADDEDETSKEKESNTRQGNNRRRTRAPRAEASKSRDSVRTAEVSSMDIVDLDEDTAALSVQEDAATVSAPQPDTPVVQDAVPVVDTDATPADTALAETDQEDQSDDHSDDGDDQSGESDDSADPDDSKSRTYTAAEGDEEIESVAGRALLRPDAQHRTRWRDQPQDHPGQ